MTINNKLVALIVLVMLSFACSQTLPFGYSIGPVSTDVPPATQAPIVVEPTTEMVQVIPTAEPIVTNTVPEPTVEPPAAEPTLEPLPTEITHNVIPVTGLPSEKAQTVYDQEAIQKAAQKEAYAGDEFLVGKYERPFDQEMNYIPFIDIIQTNFYRNQTSDFYIAIIYLQDDPALKPDEHFGYGIEVDQDLDGRGDYLIWTERPNSTEWSVEGVSIWKDANLSNGGKNPMISDPPPGGDGFEVKVFDAGAGPDPDMAWSRISPDNPKRMEITFKHSLLGDATRFLWAAWAARMENPSSFFDHHDYYTFEQAGSPTKNQKKYYPLKELYAVDNTCRSASGFTPLGNEPGICPKPLAPTSEPQEPNCVWVPCSPNAIACFPHWECD